MAEAEGIHKTIIETIAYIGQKQAQMEILRQQLNHEITFNLKDTYLAIAGGQTSVTCKRLQTFLEVEESLMELQRWIRWNSHNSSLNLSFAEFSSLLLSKEDRLLAKMTIQREAMGAIPNFLIQNIRRIMLLELSIHCYICNCSFDDKQTFLGWIRDVTDEDGDLDLDLLDQFVRETDCEKEEESELFVRYLKTTGNITAERLKFLWLGDDLNQKTYLQNQDSCFKFQKLSTQITCPTSPKSLFSPKSQKEISMRAQFFDCLNRPLPREDNELRKKKSIQKHFNRIDSQHKVKYITKIKKKRCQNEIDLCTMFVKIKQILLVEEQTEQLRIELCMCTDFYPILFFDVFPRQKNGSILASNFKDCLEEFGYHLELSQVYFLFRRYSRESGKLSFNNFCRIFDVSEDEYNLIEKNRFVESLSDISVETKKVFFELIMRAAKNQQKMNNLKVELLKECRDMSASMEYLFKDFGEGINDKNLQFLFKKYVKIDLMKKDIKLFWKKMGLNFRNEEPVQKYNLLSELVPYSGTKKGKSSS